MNRTERIYKIERLLHDRSIVPLATFLDELEISKATFKRDLEYLRDRMNAPIVWDREHAAYRFDKPNEGIKYELPGLWFSASEIHALLTMQQLLSSLGPGLLTPHVTPLLTRLRAILGNDRYPIQEFEKRIRIQRLNARAYEPEHFLPVATALLQRKRLQIEHYNRSTNQITQREISPQRLNHYQENWYLDAWCHLRKEIRRFSLDSLRAVRITAEPALDIPDEKLCLTLDSGYGIFSGHELQWAELIFFNERARWVSQETWHPEQQGKFDDAGRYHLKVPYSDPRELAMDILRHMPEVSVVAPPALRELIQEQLKRGLALFKASSSCEPPPP